MKNIICLAFLLVAITYANKFSYSLATPAPLSTLPNFEISFVQTNLPGKLKKVTTGF